LSVICRRTNKSICTNPRIDDSGRVSLGVHRPPIMLPRGTKVVHCQHPDGSWLLLKAHPDNTKEPVLFQASRTMIAFAVLF
jgi:hypothetical protein